jgi:integrase
MASVYRKTVTRPLPDGAEIYVRKGQRFARWKDGKGKSQTAKVTTGRDGSPRIVVETRTFYAKFRDGEGIVREVPTGCRTKDGALSILKELTDRAEKVKANILTPAEAAISDHQTTLLSDHIDDYREHLTARDVYAERVKDTIARLHRVCTDCQFARLPDLDQTATERWLVARRAEGMGAATHNAYRESLVGFANWCVKARRLLANPFAGLPTADVKADRRRQRRSLTEAELTRLLYVASCRPLAEYGRASVRKDKAAVNGKRDTWKRAPLSLDTIEAAIVLARQRLKDNPAFVSELELRGRERALIYKTLVLTGLRRGELASLTVAQLCLDAEPAYAMLDAADEKNRQGSTIPLRADLAADLQQWLADKAAAFQNAAQQAPTVSFESEAAKRRQCVTAGSVRFERQPCQQVTTLPADTPLFDVPKQLVKVLNRDLQAAGIPKHDERGRSIDVHALRHTFGTHLSKGGVAPRTAQAAMRHSRIDLTMNVYTDPKLLDVHGALDALPTLPLDAANPQHVSTTARRAGTGHSTPCAVAPNVAPNSDDRCKSLSIVDKATADDRETERRRTNANNAGNLGRNDKQTGVDKNLSQWAMRDSNPRPPRCKRGALTN